MEQQDNTPADNGLKAKVIDGQIILPKEADLMPSAITLEHLSAEKEEKPDFEKALTDLQSRLDRAIFVYEEQCELSADQQRSDIRWNAWGKVVAYRYSIKVAKELQQEITTLREALARLEKVVDLMKVPKPESERETFYQALEHYNELRRKIEL